MTVCPIAIAVGCAKCPIFKICPVKSVLGDVPKVAPTAAPKAAPKTTKKASPKATVSRKKGE